MYLDRIEDYYLPQWKIIRIINVEEFSKELGRNYGLEINQRYRNNDFIGYSPLSSKSFSVIYFEQS